MAGDASIFAEHMGCSNNVRVSGNDLLHFTAPLAGVFAVRPDKFLYGEMLVGVVPVHPCVGMKVFTDRVGVLPQNSIPKLLNVYPLFLLTIMLW